MTLENRLIEFYYKWHRLEITNNVDIIDFDLVCREDEFKGKYPSRKDVKTALKGLISEYENSSNFNPFIKKKLTGSLMYLNALMGESIDFNSYIEGTMGVKPISIPEHYLRKEKEKVVTSIEKLGYSYEKKDLLLFDNTTIFNSTEEILHAFKTFENRVAPSILNWLDIDLELNYEIKFVEVDAYWMNWVGTNLDGIIFLHYNIHPRKRSFWKKGSDEVMVFHEICSHAIQALNWKKMIQQNLMEPIFGLTTTFTSEQFMFEGIAQTLNYFYPDDIFSDHGLYTLHYSNLKHMVLSNAHIKINNNEDIDEICNYVQGYLPNPKKEETIKNLYERRDHPLFRAYQYIYGIGTYYHELIAEKLNRQEKKSFIQEYFSKAQHPQDILKKYALI